MLHEIALFTALAVFCAGMILKVSAWFRCTVGPEKKDLRTLRRITSASRGIAAAVSGRKALTLIRVFFLEVVFQSRVLKEDALRWFMHICIYSGFTMLLFLHALDSLVVAPLYPGYAPTLNPFLFLRDAGGALIVLGTALAVYRRFIRKAARPITSFMDIAAMSMVGLIVVSGFALEGAGITSRSAFRTMSGQYAGQAAPEQLQALETYWVKNFGLVLPGFHAPFDKAVLEKGKTVNEEYCAGCHSSTRWGFGGYAASILIRPAALALDKDRLPAFLSWVHFLSALVLLAYLPFSKMFHVVATPVSLMASSVMDRESDPANIATRQMLELDACTHCGACSLRCSVAVAVREIPNQNILPSEKIASLRRLAAGRVLDRRELRAIQQGIVLCTNCDRCSIACPAGIRLRDLWFSARERLLQRSVAEYQLLSPLAYYRGLQREAIAGRDYLKPLELALNRVAAPNGLQEKILKVGEKALLATLNASIQANSLSNCDRCAVCTNCCPVVHNFERPAEVLGLLPHQLMHAVGLRCWDLVFGSRMLWDCLGCYQCQDDCPECVSVTDIIYELKNRAISRRYGELIA